MNRIVPCLWFDGDAQEAANFYVSLLPNSHIERVLKSPADTPSGPAGTLLTIEFTLAGNPYMALNGGTPFPFTEAVSFQIHCDDQTETDRLWAAIADNGGTEVACGWIKDRWGLPWQIFPSRLVELLNDDNVERARRAQETMMQMVKIDIAEIERAAEEPSR